MERIQWSVSNQGCKYTLLPLENDMKQETFTTADAVRLLGISRIAIFEKIKSDG